MIGTICSEIEPPRETKIGSENRRVRYIVGKTKVFRETTFGSSYRDVHKNEARRIPLWAY